MLGFDMLRACSLWLTTRWSLLRHRDGSAFVGGRSRVIEWEKPIVFCEPRIIPSYGTNVVSRWGRIEREVVGLLFDVFWSGLRRCTVKYHSGAPAALSFLLLQETEDANDLRIRGYVAEGSRRSGVWGNRKQETRVSMLTAVEN
jgi:hypothetical protein